MIPFAIGTPVRIQYTENIHLIGLYCYQNVVMYIRTIKSILWAYCRLSKPLYVGESTVQVMVIAGGILEHLLQFGHGCGEGTVRTRTSPCSDR